jgi:hypothetical protein
MPEIIYGNVYKHFVCNIIITYEIYYRCYANKYVSYEPPCSHF